MARSLCTRLVSPAFIREVPGIGTVALWRAYAWASLAATTFERIEYLGDEKLRVTLTQSAAVSMLELALPRQVALARPEGFEPPTC